MGESDKNFLSKENFEDISPISTITAVMTKDDIEKKTHCNRIYAC